MRQSASLLTAMALLFAQHVAAQTTDTTVAEMTLDQWVVVASNQNIRVSVNPARISTRMDGTIRVWSRWDLPRGDTINGRRFYHSMRLFDLDCAEQQLRGVSSTSYARDGEVVFSYNELGSWKLAIPESLGEGLLREVCHFMHQAMGEL